MSNTAEKIILGSAQLGLEYGITNPGGMLAENTVEDILLCAHQIGIRRIDTAPAYGTAQARIAAVCKKNNIAFSYISKIPPCNPSEVRSIALETLDQLQIQTFDTLLLHDFSSFLQSPNLWDELLRLREQAIACRIGFSLYNPEELEHILHHVSGCDVVQIPFNVFDHRFEPLLKKCAQRGIAIHARSVFLQGAFFLDPENLPPFLHPAQQHLHSLQDFCREHRISVSALALSHALNRPEIEGIVLGVHSAAQLRENCNATVPPEILSQFLAQLHQLPALDDAILNPSLWKK